MPDTDKKQNGSDSGQEDLDSNVNKDGRIQEGGSRKGGVNDDPKTPRPSARPQPRKPSSSSSDDTGKEGDSDE